MTQLLRIPDIQAVWRRTQPRSWPSAYGFVYLAKDGEDARSMLRTLKEWADREGFPIRIPHYSARNLAGPGNELDKAFGGVLLLDEFMAFHDHDLYNVNKRIERENLPVVVVGIDDVSQVPASDLVWHSAELRDRMNTMNRDLKTIVRRDIVGEEAPAPSAAPDTSAALEAINRHRRTIGMRPLDPVSAGWTDQDILIEAERLQRLPNPYFDPRWRLVRWK